MWKGDCHPNGSYFRDTTITLEDPLFDYLQCVAPNSTLSGGEWSRTNGGPVDCNSNNLTDPLRCITTNSPANLTLYNPNGQVFQPSEDQLYKCCLPTSCSNLTYIITAYIYSKFFDCLYCHFIVQYCM